MTASRSQQSCDRHTRALLKVRHQVVSNNLMDDLQSRKYNEGRVEGDFDFSPETFPDGHLFNPLID